MSAPPLTPATARAHAMAAAEAFDQHLVLSELISFLPTATLCEFMEHFNQHLKCGDFDDLIN